MSDWTEKEYRETVTLLAEEALKAEKDGDDVNDRIHEDVDGNQWIIYYAGSFRVILYSSNDNAIFDDMGSDALSGVTNINDVVQRAAYYAMVADVNERIAELRDEQPEEDEAVAS